jgi:hypothetical protein
MRSQEEVQQAQGLVNLARKFLREKGKSDAVFPTFEFHAGALCALSWVLDGSDKSFQEHLAFIKKRQLDMAVRVEDPPMSFDYDSEGNPRRHGSNP